MTMNADEKFRIYLQNRFLEAVASRKKLQGKLIVDDPHMPKLSQTEQYENYINALYGVGREDFVTKGEFIDFIESPRKRFSWRRTLTSLTIYILYNGLAFYAFPHAGWKAFIFTIPGFFLSLFVMGVNPKKEWMEQIFYENDK